MYRVLYRDNSIGIRTFIVLWKNVDHCRPSVYHPSNHQQFLCSPFVLPLSPCHTFFNSLLHISSALDDNNVYFTFLFLYYPFFKEAFSVLMLCEPVLY